MQSRWGAAITPETSNALFFVFPLVPLWREITRDPRGKEIGWGRTHFPIENIIGMYTNSKTQDGVPTGTKEQSYIAIRLPSSIPNMNMKTEKNVFALLNSHWNWKSVHLVSSRVVQWNPGGLTKRGYVVECIITSLSQYLVLTMSLDDFPRQWNKWMEAGSPMSRKIGIAVFRTLPITVGPSHKGGSLPGWGADGEFLSGLWLATLELQGWLGRSMGPGLPWQVWVRWLGLRLPLVRGHVLLLFCS